MDDRCIRKADGRCFRCSGELCSDPIAYCYLLGQYLGDGYLVTEARVAKLRVACADSYPRIAERVDEAMNAVSGKSAGFVQAIGYTDRYEYPR